MSVVSLCLGLDVSPKRLGWALARLEDGAPVACGCEAIELPANGWIGPHVMQAMTHIEVAGKFGDKELHGFYDNEIHYVAIELPALVAKSGPKSAFMAGRAYQEAISAVRRRWPWAVVDEFMPSEWRKYAGLPGNASKADVMNHATFALGFDLPKVDFYRASQDAADAACVAVAGVRRNAETLAVPAGEAGR